MSLSSIHFENGVGEFLDREAAMSPEAAYGVVAAYWNSVGFRPPKFSSVREAQGMTMEAGETSTAGDRLMFAPFTDLAGAEAMAGGELWTPYETWTYKRLLSSETPDRSIRIPTQGQYPSQPSYVFGYKLPDGGIGRRKDLTEALLESGNAVEDSGIIWTIDSEFDTRPATELADGNLNGADDTFEAVKPQSIMESHIAINAFHSSVGISRPGINDQEHSELVNQVVCRSTIPGLIPKAIGSVGWNSYHRKLGLTEKPLFFASRGFVAR
ncbi:MAG: hypothetical protein AAB436_03925 [Patescibacteria group bacterium]